MNFQKLNYTLKLYPKDLQELHVILHFLNCFFLNIYLKFVELFHNPLIIIQILFLNLMNNFILLLSIIHNKLKNFHQIIYR
jgi:hypothetical protein